MKREEAEEARLKLKPMYGMRTVIRKGNPDSENSYYADYESISGMSCHRVSNFNLKRELIIDLNIKKESDKKAPAGRTKEAHNRIIALNSKNKNFR